jgi:hypothetical protein
MERAAYDAVAEWLVKFTQPNEIRVGDVRLRPLISRSIIISSFLLIVSLPTASPLQRKRRPHCAPSSLERNRRLGRA